MTQPGRARYAADGLAAGPSDRPDRRTGSELWSPRATGHGSGPTRRSFLAASAAASGLAFLQFGATVYAEASGVGSPSAAGSAANGGGESIRPFHVKFAEAELVDLRRRVVATRWPDKEAVTDHSQGLPLATMQKLAQYWATEYDWRKVEARLNALPKFVTEIDGLDIHFIHVRSKHPNALPMIITHGWPGSIIEQMKVIGPLTDPIAYGGKAEDSFDVVIPSLPGYGFSGKPTDAGVGPDPHRARLDRADEAPGLHAICRAGRRLGKLGDGADGARAPPELIAHPYEHGGHGAGGRCEGPASTASRRRPVLRPRAPRGTSLTTSTSTAWDTPGDGEPPSDALRASRTRRSVSRRGCSITTCGSEEMITRVFDGKTEGLTRDDVLDNITLYWLTNTAVSSARLYWEYQAAASSTPGG